MGTSEPLTCGTNKTVVHRFLIYKFCLHISKITTFKKYKNVKGKSDDEVLTAAVNDVLPLQISIRAAARKAWLIRYVKKARENLITGTKIPLKVLKLSMASMQVLNIEIIF